MKRLDTVQTVDPDLAGGARTEARDGPDAAAALDAIDVLDAAVRTQQKGLWRYLRTLGATATDADELAIEAFVVAHDKGALRRDADALAMFLRATARNLWLRRRRWISRDRERLAAAADLVWQRRCGVDLTGDDRVATLRDCVGRLHGRAAEAIRLVHGDGLTQRDAARALGLRRAGLKTLLHRTRQWLRACLERSRT